MNLLVQRFFQQLNEDPNFEAPFFEVLFLEQNSHLPFEKYKEMAPNILRGWHELSQLNQSDRVEFVKEFWLKVIPFQPQFHSNIELFFSKLDDVGVYLTKGWPEGDFEAEIVYSLMDGTSFFRGQPPATTELLSTTQTAFKNKLPKDFLNFNKIHNGFCKYLNNGIIPLKKMKRKTMDLHQSILENEQMLTCNGKNVDPISLIPFYEYVEKGSFQCFYEDWYPTTSMGNVRFSKEEFSISDFSSRVNWEKTLSFPTFLHWLSHYLREA